MVSFDISKLNYDQRLRVLKKAVEKHGKAYIARVCNVNLATIYRYLNGQISTIPDEVVEKALQTLTVEEISDAIYGLRIVEVDPTTALSVVVKAMKDEGFRNFFLSLLYKYLGDYLKQTSHSYVVTEEDVELFEKIVRETRTKKTADDLIRYLTRALAELNNELTPDRLKEYIFELTEENRGRARHTAKALKLFIKEVVKTRDSHLARELYESFKISKAKTNYRPVSLSLDTLKQIFNNIEDLGAKAFFLILTETGLRVGEVLNLRVDQIDLEHRVIRIMKESETKRAYISFLHEGTAKWLKEVYLPYREDFVKRYELNVRKLAEANPDQNIDIEAWKTKLFPIREDMLRAEIKIAMRKVGKEFRLYDLRSFFASYMIKQGVSPMIVNLLQGRAPPQQFQILQNHYLAISDIELQQYYDKYAPRLLETVPTYS
ncbi:putative phage integrase [Saccharolobus shibatae B12]|uniref:Phage integrase n=1 Tax=Saccharolobus shibatae (strain ATCC 51178 / DSM 5389 / JCM 8931 / NBRC 15437 / B12) TaxID=523848 RepID=A0A8F5BR26_SACSH|nr:site-specific integrase [Saccharolobus shibatae]QXJ29738.1 putative phage integrase [Saccharolobus shibatae B12]